MSRLSVHQIHVPARRGAVDLRHAMPGTYTALSARGTSSAVAADRLADAADGHRGGLTLDRTATGTDA
jgi:hypothetical protein